METCKLTRLECKYAPFNPGTDECYTCIDREELCNARCPHYCDTDSVDINSLYPKTLFDTRAIKPEKYAELREQDFDTWLDTILHEIIEQVNFDASEVDALVRQSNQLDAHNAKLELLEDKVDALKGLFKDLETQINDLSIRFDEFVSPHTGSNFCGNCTHCSHIVPDATYRCELSGEDVDPDDSSCAMFEHPF